MFHDLALPLRAAAAATTALGLGLGFVPLVIRYGRRRGFKDREGKTHSETLNQLHAKKRDTPVLGGLAILAASLLSMAVWTDGNFYVLLLAGVLVALGAVGVTDDFVKTFGKDKREGLTPRQKLAAQVSVGLAAGAFLVLHWGGVQAFSSSPAFALDSSAGVSTAATGVETWRMTSVHAPFVRDALFPIGAFFFVGLCALVLTATSNAVNLTDGLDGLAGGPWVVSIATFGVLAALAGRPEWAASFGLQHVPGASEIAVSCAALAGATVAFLWFNAHPAELFMGDAGSLPLGGALGLVAVMTKHELLLPLVALVFVAEAASVIAQVSWFKLTKTRLLRCAPLHHHFEFAGWAETKVVARFWIASAVAAGFALASLGVR